MDERYQPLRHFLLVFDHAAGRLKDAPLEYEDVQKALLAYEEAEADYDQDSNIEVVLIGSDSIETVKLTHANYFDGTAALARALAGILRLESAELPVGDADMR